MNILILAALALGCYLTGYFRAREHFRDATKMSQQDTVVRYDTIRMKEPGEIRSFKSSVPLILPLSDTIRLRDTVYLVLDREIKEYRDSLFYARVSGYEPSLDYIEVYPRSVVISKTETATIEPSPWRYSLSVGLDYGRMRQRYFNPNIAALIEYRRMALGVECGLNMELDGGQLQAPAPYMQASFKYRIAGR